MICWPNMRILIERKYEVDKTSNCACVRERERHIEQNQVILDLLLRLQAPPITYYDCWCWSSHYDNRRDCLCIAWNSWVFYNRWEYRDWIEDVQEDPVTSRELSYLVRAMNINSSSLTRNMAVLRKWRNRKFLPEK